MAHDVFVSYSSKDKAIADSVVSSLENKHIRCWYAPRDVKPSENWGKAISDAIEQSKVFLVIFSGNANKSQRVLDELNYAISREEVILPFRIENLEPVGAMRLNLTSRHWLDAYDPSWEKHLSRLTKTVASILEKPDGEIETGIPKLKGEKNKKQQTNKLYKIIAGVVMVVILLTAGWFGFSSLNNRGSGVTTFSTAVTSTPQEIPAVQGSELTETPTAIPEQPTIEPTLQNSISELGIPDYETDFSSFGLEDHAWDLNQRDDDGEVTLGSDGTLIVQNYISLLYPRGKKYVDSIFEMDAKFLSLEEYRSGSILLLCRIDLRPGNSDESGYKAFFSSTGKVLIGLNEKGVLKTISEGKTSRFEVGKFYRLRFDCVGTNFKAFVNGSLIATGNNNGFYSGYLGVTAENESGPGRVTAAFDNFKLWLP